MVPTHLDENSATSKSFAINAALVAGLYPKILVQDPSGSPMRTLGNNQGTSFHPSSINFGRKISEVLSGGHALVYFTLMWVAVKFVPMYTGDG